VGLAVSLALVVILSAYCYSEITTDRFHKNGDRIYFYGDLKENLFTPSILKEAIDKNLPAVEATVRISGPWEPPVFQTDTGEPFNSDILFADKNFFDVFTYKPLEGNIEAALNEPMSLVITNTLAKKLFGETTAIGKTVKYNNDKELTVTAVIEVPKANSCLSFNAVTSMETRKLIQPSEGEFTMWNWYNFLTFILLKDDTTPNETAKNILSVMPSNERENYARITPIPFKSIYFSKFKLYDGDYLRCGNKTQVMILFMIAILVLVIALVNFVNINSTKWLDKIKQTGIMKIIGARRFTVVRYMLSEALFVFLAAFLISLIIVKTMLPSIQNYTGIDFYGHMVLSPYFLTSAVVVTFILSVVFSIIPALGISSSRAIDNLKKEAHRGSQRSLLRGILVTSQFVIAIVLIQFTILIQKQVSFGSNLGFNKENTVGIKLSPELSEKKDVLKNFLKTLPNVNTISFSQYYPGKTLSCWYSQLESDGTQKDILFDTFCADSAFFDVMGLETVKGRFYSDQLSTDASAIVVNESFMNKLNLTDPVGIKIKTSNGELMEIVGVVKDFHYKPVSQPIIPLAIRHAPNASYCMVNIPAGDFNQLNKTIKKIRTEAAELSPHTPVEISFLDQAVEKLYQAEVSFRRTFTLFAGCAIILSCLGILAMSIFTCQQRIKEIGIRRVNGARTTEVMAMLNKDFIKWVVIAFIIACPIAWYAMHKWLANFAYKTTLSWWIFAAAGIAALLIALLTLSWQSWRAATRNPVESLRYE
jgi:putative ABC transport system permease protein